jgi:hypothetical protein
MFWSDPLRHPTDWSFQMSEPGPWSKGKFGRTLCKVRGWGKRFSQRGFAWAMGIDENKMRGYEEGTIIPSPARAEYLIKAFREHEGGAMLKAAYQEEIAYWADRRNRKCKAW